MTYKIEYATLYRGAIMYHDNLDEALRYYDKLVTGSLIKVITDNNDQTISEEVMRSK